MRIQFPNFESGVRNTTILYRGRDMYHEGSVQNVYSTGANSWEFDVSSAYSRGVSYEVNIRVQDGRVAYKNCTCPYDRSSLCKHIVACFYVIRAQDLLGDGAVDDEEESDEDGYYGNNYYDDDDDEDEEEDEDEDDEEEEEEEEEVDNSMEVDRIINERKVAKEMKVLQDKKGVQNAKTEILTRKKEGEDFVENEFHCQVCLEVMDDPVLMPCNAHSMCYDCALMMFKHKSKEADGHRKINCPTCGEASGAFRFKSVKDIKINLEMKRIKEAYDTERRAWSQEKETLQEIVSQVKPHSEASEDNSEESEESEDSYKVKKVVKTKEKGVVIDKEIEAMDVKKLQEAAGKILIKLKSKGVKLDSFVQKILKEGESKTDDKSKRLKRKAEDSSNKENTETEDRYPLRSLKRTKTTGH